MQNGVFENDGTGFLSLTRGTVRILGGVGRGGGVSATGGGASSLVQG